MQITAMMMQTSRTISNKSVMGGGLQIPNRVPLQNNESVGLSFHLYGASKRLFLVGQV